MNPDFRLLLDIADSPTFKSLIESNRAVILEAAHLLAKNETFRGCVKGVKALNLSSGDLTENARRAITDATADLDLSAEEFRNSTSDRIRKWGMSSTLAGQTLPMVAVDAAIEAVWKRA